MKLQPTLKQGRSARALRWATLCLALVATLTMQPKGAEASTYQSLYTFQGYAGAFGGGVIPGDVILAADGNAYGVTLAGGANNAGDVYKLSATGIFTELHTFSGTDGSSPVGAPIRTGSGDLYGVTQSGGAHSFGTVYKITSSGTFSVLHAFAGADGGQPVRIILAADGNYYGVTVNGGSSNNGTIFKMTPSGQLTSLYSFAGGTDGFYPDDLIQGSDGNLYGTTQIGGPGSNGSNGNGIVFKYVIGGTKSLVFAFYYDSGLGYSPYGALPEAIIQGRDGNLYGTAFGGHNNTGVAFKLTTAGVITVLYTFPGSTTASPTGKLAETPDGSHYGVTAGCCPLRTFGALYKIDSSGVFTQLYQFNYYDSAANGGQPRSGLSLGIDGNLYGTMTEGGLSGAGTVFRATTAGAITPLYMFSGLADGSQPNTVLRAQNGDLIGTTSQGGPTNQGTIFKFSQGSESVLYPFLNSKYGANPATLLLAANGNYYGVTQAGGTNSFGTIFEWSATGTYSTLYSFTGAADGGAPAGLIQGDDGNLYGFTTKPAGIFRYSLTSGFNFLRATGSLLPTAIYEASDRNLYVTLVPTGFSSLTTELARIGLTGGPLTTVYTFPDQYQINSMVQGTDGLLYATTSNGGPALSGSMFSLPFSGSQTPTALLWLDGASNYTPGALAVTNGGQVVGTLQPGNGIGGQVISVVASHGVSPIFQLPATVGGTNVADGGDGNIYSVTGPGNTLFELSGALPVVSGLRAIPISATVGSSITLSGFSTAGLSSVKFNGTNASFTINSQGAATTVVPVGATSGHVTATTTAGPQQSAQSFVVLTGSAPVVDTFTPDGGPVGSSIVLAGSGLKKITAVTVGGASATFSAQSDTQATVTVPNAQSGSIVITSPGGSWATSTFFVTPEIDNFQPRGAAVGSTVTISGQAFNNVQAVTFGGTSALYVVTSSQQILATVPPGAASGDIDVTTASGDAEYVGQFAVGTMARRHQALLPFRFSGFQPKLATASWPIGISDGGALNGNQPVDLAMVLRDRQADQLVSLVEAQTKFGTQLRGKFLNPATANAYFSTPLSNYARVLTTLRRAGFVITGQYRNRKLVDVRGSASTVDRFFATKLHRVLQSGEGWRYASSTLPTIPAILLPDVETVIGINNFVVAESAVAPARQPSVYPSYRVPLVPRAPLRSPTLTYPLNGGVAAKIVIGDIVNSVPSIGDVLLFGSRNGLNLTRSRISTTIVDGSGPLLALSEAATIDAETILAVAPTSQVRDYLVPEFTAKNLVDAVNSAADEGTVDQLHVNIALCSVSGSAMLATIDAIAQRAAAGGIPLVMPANLTPAKCPGLDQATARQSLSHVLFVEAARSYAIRQPQPHIMADVGLNVTSRPYFTYWFGGVPVMIAPQAAAVPAFAFVATLARSPRMGISLKQSLQEGLQRTIEVDLK